MKKYGIKTIRAQKIQYGGSEWSVVKPKKNTLAVLVDFAHGKPMMHIHTDHHDKQVGHDEKSTSTHFKHSKSNLETISTQLSPNDLFPPVDVKTINTVDSADFEKQGLTPDDIMRSAFKIDKSLSVERNRMMMGLVVNKLLLAFKNKPNFLEELVMNSNPSLMSMYHVIVDLAKKNGYDISSLSKKGDDYVQAQKDKIQQVSNVNAIKNFKNGESGLFGTIIVQYGGGNMRYGGYDRYTPFKNNPSGEFLIIGWPLGLVQASKNPFKKDATGVHLGDMAQKVLNKNKSKLTKMVSLDYIKYLYEKDIIDKGIEGAVGFTMSDLIALFKGTIKGDLKGMKFLMDKKYNQLTYNEKQRLKEIEISVWDIIQKSSGGHKNITNISGINFLGKAFTDFIKELMVDLTKELQSLLK